jgi:hypothetical protein
VRGYGLQHPIKNPKKEWIPTGQNDYLFELLVQAGKVKMHSERNLFRFYLRKERQKPLSSHQDVGFFDTPTGQGD